MKCKYKKKCINYRHHSYTCNYSSWEYEYKCYNPDNSDTIKRK